MFRCQWTLLEEATTHQYMPKNKLKKQPKPHPSYTLKQNYRKMNQQEFLNYLSSLPWSEIEAEVDINVAVEQFTSYITQALDIYAPLKKVQANNSKRQKFTLSKNTMEDCKLRDKIKNNLLRNADSQRDPSVVAEYRRIRNKCTSMIRKEKRHNIEDQLIADPSSANVW